MPRPAYAEAHAATPKIYSCCTLCDGPCFEVIARHPDTQRPVAVGRPLENAMRLTFRLRDKSAMDLTFCEECARTLKPSKYEFIWQRVVLSWLGETKGRVTEFIKGQGENAIVSIIKRQPWRELA